MKKMKLNIQMFGGRGASSSSVIAKAEKLGEKAFSKGIKRQPTLDKDMMGLLKGDKIGESSNKLNAWLKGWDNANINAEIKPSTTTSRSMLQTKMPENSDLTKLTVSALKEYKKTFQELGRNKLAERVQKEIDRRKRK